MSPASLKKLYDADSSIAVIDVRTPAEFQEAHAFFAELTPLETLDPKRVAKNAGAGTLYVFCRSGERATMACEKFIAQGINDVCVVQGGILAWEAAGLPVVRGRKVISLERQVRIAAGSLVLLGLTLGYTVHPGFIGISAFVGCGLVFAGITNTCGLGILLALAPWNQR
ncbi:MAG: rhodanese-like domain-containing protein, partial [Candidatus Hydrogenedentes bacterium]|nr:rhodanese-like domain-containing protein [Candidatus Hydrogenedentota bacterium]